jgi:hypothetical protein
MQARENIFIEEFFNIQNRDKYTYRPVTIVT